MTRIVRAALLAVMLAGAGCASAGSSNDTQAQIRVVINNNLIPPSTTEIFLVPNSGIERSLGTISGSGLHELRYTGIKLAGENQLVARTRDSRTVFSTTLVMDGVQAIKWDLMRNYLEVAFGDR